MDINLLQVLDQLRETAGSNVNVILLGMEYRVGYTNAPGKWKALMNCVPSSGGKRHQAPGSDQAYVIRKIRNLIKR